MCHYVPGLCLSGAVDPKTSAILDEAKVVPVGKEATVNKKYPSGKTSIQRHP
jgi:hypothetical protein